jgi:hypothetical protein
MKFEELRFFTPHFIILIGDKTDEIRMNLKLSNVISIVACLLGAVMAQSAPKSSTPEGPQGAKAPADARQAPQVVYTTRPKRSVAMLKLGEAEALEVRGLVTFTLTAANYDDTMLGTVTFAISEESRKKIAEASCEPLTSVPKWVTRKDVVGVFRNGTSCPLIDIELGPTELDLAGGKLSLNRITVDVPETPQKVPQHFCLWTRQINANRPHRGVIASLNSLITVEQ